MKKALIVSLFLVPLVALADEVAPVVTGAKVPFDWKMFLQQIATNGGLVLLAFLCSKIPVVGPYLQKIIDVIVGNPAHK